MVVSQRRNRVKSSGRSARYSNSSPVRGFAPFRPSLHEPAVPSPVAQAEALASVLHSDTSSDVIDAIRWDQQLRSDVQMAIEVIGQELPDAEFLLTHAIEEISPTFTLYVTSEVGTDTLLEARYRVLEEFWSRPIRDITTGIHIAFRPR